MNFCDQQPETTNAKKKPKAEWTNTKPGYLFDQQLRNNNAKNKNKETQLCKY